MEDSWEAVAGVTIDHVGEGFGEKDKDILIKDKKRFHSGFDAFAAPAANASVRSTKLLFHSLGYQNYSTDDMEAF